MPLGMELGLSPSDFVLDGDPALPPQKGGRAPPQFSAHFYCGQTAACIKMQLGTEVRRHCVRWRSSSPSPNGAQPHPQFSAHFYCGQTAAWIKMSLGMGLGLDPGDFVLHGDPAPSLPKRAAEPPNFRPCLLWPNGLMDEAGTWQGGKPQPR